MIGLDTNVLLRWLIDESVWPGTRPEETALAAETIQNSTEKFYVNSVVFAETVWVLSQPMKMPRKSIVEIVEKVLKSTNLDVEHRDAFRNAVRRFGKEPAGLNDCVINELNTQAGCRTTLTFDKKAGGTSGFTRLSRKDP